MSKSQKKKQESTTSDDDYQYEYYPKYILESQGQVTINITISGNGNDVRVLSGQPSNPPVKPPGGGNG